MPTQNQASLYNRFGGVYGFATAVADFTSQVMANQRMTANPGVNEAHHRVSPTELKYLATEMVCCAVGKPQRHTGRWMPDSR